MGHEKKRKTGKKVWGEKKLLLKKQTKDKKGKVEEMSKQ